MKNWIARFVIFLFLSINHSLEANDFPLNYLKFFADGLNIEGGVIPQKYLRKEQIWANLCVILDRPFEDGVEWQELTNLNTFPLKEATILDYNEAQVNFAYATIMHYYMTYAHQIVNKSEDQVAKILIQVHRNTSGPNQLELLKNLILRCYPHFQGVKQQRVDSSKYELYTYFFPTINVEINFCYGTAPENLGEMKKYEEFDIILSFSLVAGLNPAWKSGSLLVSNHYIPFSLKQLNLFPKEEYFIRNHLKEVLPDLIENQSKEVLKLITQQFGSLNSNKSHMQAKPLTLEDFKEATLLQVDGLFNPSQLPPNFQLECSAGSPDQKVVFITGTSQGIGYETVQAFAKKGWSVWAGSRNPSKMDNLNVHAIYLDVKNERSIQKAIRTILSQEGRIDALVNNAGYLLISPLEIENFQEISNLFEVNFFGLVKLTNLILPIMRHQKAGYVINLSSTGGIQAVPYLGYFSASKYALEAYSECLAAELSPWQIKVSIIEPANVNTPWTNNSIVQENKSVPEYQIFTQALLERITQGKKEEGSEIGKMIVSITEDSSPNLRYQTCEKARILASNRWLDPSGMAYLKQQINFLEFLKSKKL